MKRTWPALAPAILLSLVGANISYLLMGKHLAGTTGAAWFDSVCEGDADSTVSCDDVLASRYGLFPPVPPDVDPQDKYKPRAVLGMFEMTPRPVALLGLMYFIALAGWYLAIGRPSPSQRLWHLLPLLLTLCGACGSAFFAYVMFFTDLEAWCPWCLVTHVINGLLLVFAILLWPRKPAAVAAVPDPSEVGGPSQVETATSRGGGSATPAHQKAPAPNSGRSSSTDAATHRAAAPHAGIAHPSLRLVLVTLAAIVAAQAAEWYFHDFAAKTKQYAALDRAVEAVRNHGATLYSMYETGQKHEIPIRKDDPIKKAGPMRVVLVIFTDFECPHCRRFQLFLDEMVVPIFDGHLKIVFKYFPTNKACNQRVKDLHPNACRAASAAEAARALGGNAAFWKAHDALFASGRKLAEFDYPALAGQLSLDPDEFLRKMDSAEVQDRIRQDIALGFEVGVNATPALYLSGKRVPRLAVRSPFFWRAAKQRLDRIIRAREAQKAKQQPKTPDAPTKRPQPQTTPAATPGNPGP